MPVFTVSATGPAVMLAAFRTTVFSGPRAGPGLECGVVLVVVSLIQPVVKPARLLAWGLLPVLLAACSTRSPDRGADEPYGGYAPIVIRRATFPLSLIHI